MTKSLYRTVLKSSSLIGGASMINILIGMVKTKFVAILLGPSGIGLMNVYNSIIQPVSTVAGLGLHTSGVRQIAAANGEKDEAKVSKVVYTLRFTCWFTGGIGALVMMLLSPWLSQWTFGSREHTLPIAILGSVVLITNISQAQRCIIQGKRRIKDLAKMQILGALNGTLFSIPLFYFFGEKGILPSLILLALAGLATSWWYARKIQLSTEKPNKEEIKNEASALIGFGLPLMLSAFVTALFAYLIRILLIDRFGTEGVGQWAAAMGISGILVNFVLQAMGADYYPRLTAVAHDHAKMREEVNAQAHIALLLALPALLATMLFAPLAIQIFYSGRFDDAIPILRWTVFGMFGRIVSWPLGFIIVATGRGKFFFINELLGNLALYLGMMFFIQNDNIIGSGQAMAFQYGIGIVKGIVYSYLFIKFKWSKQNAVTLVTSFLVLLVAFFATISITNHLLYYSISAATLALISVLCLKAICAESGISLQSIIVRIKK